MEIPTSEQREQWESLARAARAAAEETDDLTGIERMVAQAEVVSERASDG